MYKEVLRSIENIEIYPVISLLIFVLFFLGVFYWVTRMPKDFVDHMKSLPMDKDENLTEHQP
ncbi:cbb3-type cytochrome c oxidase subunit 3 [Algoriphagus sp. CAU 1675]|uniref:cbb3-type cytochrome c oxidase subunit 3 n=1 Tax=Algoriphagus sp. CAU 1675 TaxID=3032597 RepID=UPI0023DC2B29|nr:cbb3-type cytochrome c oxidase subunit 3 [Algoriphagus sp. CAU 1675]MDF2158633.1 cbb3-type cytochrome c oxidase subunit 3 [Algoriphagus sp. CAU 1675]